jgi:hypothetical protein
MVFLHEPSIFYVFDLAELNYRKICYVLHHSLVENIYVWQVWTNDHLEVVSLVEKYSTEGPQDRVESLD